MTASTSADQLQEVRFHRRALAEARELGFEPSVLAITLEDAWKRLRATRGSKLRSLSGTSGKEFRLRVDTVRAVFSVVKDARDRALAFVHLVAPRDAVYRRASFADRIKHFYQTVWSNVGRELLASDEESRYVLIESQFSAPLGIDVDLEFDLFEQQQAFFNSVLPFSKPLGIAEPLLVIGYGPPGSGKTIVGCQLLTEAWRAGHDVDVLVPSVRLRDDYRAHIAIQHSTTERDNLLGTATWRVCQFDEYFAQAGNTTIPADRLSRLRDWWSRLLAVRTSGGLADRLDRLMQKGELSSRQVRTVLPVFLDALIDDDDWLSRAEGSYRKDPLAGDFATLAAFVRKNADELKDQLLRADLDVPTRGELAGTVLRNHPSRTGKRLILVDEAQDMAPSEWRALLHLAFGSHNSADDKADWRVVMLGDMRQRVSLVPFDWSEVKACAFHNYNVPSDRLIDAEVDAVSYRMGRRIAQAAGAFFNPYVVAQQRVRQQGRMDLQQLDDRGEVTVLVVDIERAAIAQQIRSCQGKALEQENLQVVYQPTEDDGLLLGLPQTFCDPVWEVKGLEYDSVIVLARPLAKRGRAEQVLSGENSTELYTALSRAREKVLLLAPPSLWEVLQRAIGCWDHAKVLKGGEALRALPAALQECRVLLSESELRAALLERLTRLCDAQPEDPDGWTTRIVETATRLTAASNEQLDTVLSLTGMGVALVQSQRGGYDAIRKEALRAKEGGKDELACTLLVLLGETALAADIATSAHVTRRPMFWSGPVLETCRDASRFQQQRSLTGINWNGPVWTSETFKHHMLERVTSRVRNNRNVA